MVLAEGRPSVDFCSHVAFPNRETVNEIKTIFVFISTVDCTFSNEHLHEKMYAFGQHICIFLDIWKDVLLIFGHTERHLFSVLDIWKDTILDIWKDTMLDIWKDKLLNS